MRQILHTSTGFGPVAYMASVVRLRARASYLSSRWVQAPIPDRREADT